MRKKIGQQIIIGLEGTALKESEAEFIVKNNIAGVILFNRNLESPTQIHKLVTDVQNLRFKMPDKLPLFVSIDMEGGRVHRLKDPFTQWPAIAHLGTIDSTNATFEFALSMGRELKAFGINLNYAPCADVFLNPKNEIIGDRSFSSDPEVVSRHVSAMTRGYIKSQVVPCAKHFPGHGSTLIDSHEDLPVDDRNLKQLEESGELEPFKKVVRSRVSFIMTAHIKFPNIDPEWPVTLSEIFLQQLLRGALRYKNIIISDDLGMKAITKNYKEEMVPIRALNAGVNMLLYCNEFEAPSKAINNIAKALSDGTLTEDIIEQNYELVVATKNKVLVDPIEPYSLEKAEGVLAEPTNKQLAQSISENRKL